MSRGLDDPGLNPNMSDFMRELNEKAQRERDNNFATWKAVAQQSHDEKVKASEKRVQERIEAIKKEEAEKLRKEHGINSAEIDNAWKDLANSFKHSPEKNIVATIV